MPSHRNVSYSYLVGYANIDSIVVAATSRPLFLALLGYVRCAHGMGSLCVVRLWH